MTDDHDAPLDPAEEERVRRALASAAAPGPMPEQVTARLDDVLAGLAAERASTRTLGTSAHHDRAASRRRWPGLLAAAAAVVLLALGVGSLVRGTTGGQGEAQSAAGRAEATAQGTLPPPAQPLTGEGAPVAALPRLRSASFARDVRRLLAAPPTAGLVDGRRAATPGPTEQALRCLRPPRPAGATIRAVVLDGRVATLVVGPLRHGVRTVEVYACRDVGTPLATTAVPRR